MSVVYRDGFMRGLKPDDKVSIDEWAENNRILPTKSSSEPGAWRNDRTPYLREIMWEMSPHSATEQVKVIKGTQLGFTEVGLNTILAYMDLYPCPILMVMPVETLAKKFSNAKLTPSIKAIPHLNKKIKNAKSIDDGGGTFEKDFDGGMFSLGWSYSASAFASFSAKVVVLDDVDRFPDDVEDEGDPLELGKNRADAFAGRKIYINSTPTTKDASKIEREFEDSDQREYFMPCPHCTPKEHALQHRGNMIRFTIDAFRYEKDSSGAIVGDPYMVCGHCGGIIDEHEKSWMMSAASGAKWIPLNPGHIHRGYKLNSFYSPLGWLGWKNIAQEHVKAHKAMKRGNNKLLKKFMNTRLAETFEEEIEKVDDDVLMEHVETYEAQVPEGVLVLTAGIDTQDDRLEIEVVGWGHLDESWSIDYRVFHGDTRGKEVWSRLDEYLFHTRFKRKDGSEMMVHTSCLDTGGHRTKESYAFALTRFLRRLYAIKGAKPVDAPIIPRKPTRKDRKKPPLFNIGVNKIKDVIYDYMMTDEKGAGYMHFPDLPQYDKGYFKQLTAEKREKSGRWVKFRERNEALDVRVYAYAALHLSGMDLNIIKERGPVVVASTDTAGVATGTTKKRRRRIISSGVRR